MLAYRGRNCDDRVLGAMQVEDLSERIRRCAMPNGTLQCRDTRLRQEGELRFAPDRPWLPFKAEQWFLGSGIEFRWRARVRMAALVRASVVDSFEGGKGKLSALLLAFVPLARSWGPATDKARPWRGLAELPWRPFAFREAPYLAWERVGIDKLHASFDDGTTQAAVEFKVDSEGHVLACTASSRPRTVGKALVETRWAGAFRE